VLRRALSGYSCFPDIAYDPWLEAVRKKGAFTTLMRQAEARHRDALAAFARLGGHKVFGAGSSSPE
jgi:hypothetical protein